MEGRWRGRGRGRRREESKGEWDLLTFASASTPKVPGMKVRENLEHEDPMLDARLLMMFSVVIT